MSMSLGAHYRSVAEQGDPFYRHVHFFTGAELTNRLTRAQLTVTAGRYALGWDPPAEPPLSGAMQSGESGAGFAAVLARPFQTYSNQR